MEKTVLVTGANGFVGKALCLGLLSLGVKVKAIVRQPGVAAFSTKGIEETVVEDYSETGVWDSLLTDVDCIIHCVARTHVTKEKAENPLQAYRHVNVDLTEKLLTSAIQHNVRRFIFLSSIKVNGESTTGRAFVETDPPAPLEPYGQSKLEAENLVTKLILPSNTDFVIIRPPLVYGPGVKANFLFLIKLVQKKIPLPFASVKNARSLIAIDNLVNFVLTCVQHPKAANQTFLISDGKDVSTAQLIQSIAQQCQQKPFLLPFPVACIKFAALLTGKQALQRRLLGSLQVNIQKAQSLLGWKPVISMEEALQHTINAIDS